MGSAPIMKNSKDLFILPLFDHVFSSPGVSRLHEGMGRFGYFAGAKKCLFSEHYIEEHAYSHTPHKIKG